MQSNAISDCQISASTAASAAYSHLFARPGQASCEHNLADLLKKENNLNVEDPLNRGSQQSNINRVSRIQDRNWLRVQATWSDDSHRSLHVDLADWAPALNSFEPYIEFHFGNLTEISQITFELEPTGAVVTGYRVMRSDDGIGFTEVETVSYQPRGLMFI